VRLLLLDGQIFFLIQNSSLSAARAAHIRGGAQPAGTLFSENDKAAGMEPARLRCRAAGRNRRQFTTYRLRKSRLAEGERRNQSTWESRKETGPSALAAIWAY
jgi:hypothetical protein